VTRPRVLNKKTDGVPEGAVYVGRPTKWGNPWVVGKDGTREQCVNAYERKAAMLYEQDPTRFEELRGKDLVCWCAPEACHADVLLELANS
jgi:hypothetical protein